jgi:hypothetical protein
MAGRRLSRQSSRRVSSVSRNVQRRSSRRVSNGERQPAEARRRFEAAMQARDELILAEDYEAVFNNWRRYHG